MLTACVTQMFHKCAWERLPGQNDIVVSQKAEQLVQNLNQVVDALKVPLKCAPRYSRKVVWNDLIKVNRSRLFKEQKTLSEIGWQEGCDAVDLSF